MDDAQLEELIERKIWASLNRMRHYAWLDGELESALEAELRYLEGR